MAAKHSKGPTPARPQQATRSAAIELLLAQVAHGDSDAFAALYDQVAGTVYSLVHGMVGDRVRSEHVTADVLTEVWRTASEFDPAAGSGMSWIVAIARRRAVGHVQALRATDNGRASLAQVIKEVAEQAGVSADQPDPQRQALLLILHGGYSQGQVADLLVVPPGTVSAWLRDQLPRLRDHAKQ